ncbi:hypothetical protein [Mycolicibacterium austroafricanum]|uniref:hypothetical protein n=1 Tax=Mycolicibacterium austroafricanum TaxID=39687 RepID=UPI001CA35005|nr:hypothetical protein [Mycolicibacterium austroafricanum]QZT62287.1 hypothetical protein JN085_25930 [Mycolicibacterium austroafricanum]
MKWVAVIAGVAAMALGYGALFFLGSGSTDAFVAEDQIVETVGALGLFATSVLLILLLIVGRRTGQLGAVKQISLMGLVLLFLFGAGEEISWGQRYLGLATPSSWESRNVQGELNLHNVDTLSGWLDSDYLFRAFWIVFGVAVPVAAAVSMRMRAKIDRLIPVFPLWVAAFLVLNQIIAEAASVLDRQRPTWYEGEYYTFDGARFEVTESVIAVIFAVGAYALYRRTRVAAATGAVKQSKPAATGTDETEDGT